MSNRILIKDILSVYVESINPSGDSMDVRIYMHDKYKYGFKITFDSCNGVIETTLQRQLFIICIRILYRGSDDGFIDLDEFYHECQDKFVRYLNEEKLKED